MRIFALFKQPDINAGVAKYNLPENAALLDVRPPEEYQCGHILESRNVLQTIEDIASRSRNQKNVM